MMVKLSSTAPDIQGKIGGDIWRRDQCRQHIQARPRRVRRQTRYQNRYFTISKMLWNTYPWTDELLARWREYGFILKTRTKKGIKYGVIPYNAFIKVNVPRLAYGSDPVYDPLTMTPYRYGINLSPGPWGIDLAGKYVRENYYNNAWYFHCIEKDLYIYRLSPHCYQVGIALGKGFPGPLGSERCIRNDSVTVPFGTYYDIAWHEPGTESYALPYAEPE